MVDDEGREYRFATGSIPVDPQEPGSRVCIPDPAPERVVEQYPVAGTERPPVSEEVVIDFGGFIYGEEGLEVNPRLLVCLCGRLVFCITCRQESVNTKTEMTMRSTPYLEG